MDLVDLFFRPSRYRDCLATTGGAMEYTGSSTAIDEKVGEPVDVFPIDGQMVRDAAFVLVALDVEKADLSGVQGDLTPCPLLGGLQFILFKTDIKIMPAIETAVFC